MARKRFRESYRKLKECFTGQDFPGEPLAFSIFKATFAANPEFATACAIRTVDRNDVHKILIDVMQDQEPSCAAALMTCSETEFEMLVENLAFLAQDLGYGGANQIHT
jgi:hypothetical protein